MYMENVFACLQNNLTDGEEDLPEDSFSLLSVLLVGSLNFPFDRSRLAPRRQPSGRPFARKLWSKLARCIPLFPFLFHPLFHLLLSSVPLFFHAFRIFSRVNYNLFIFYLSRLLFAKMKYHRIISISSIYESPFRCFCMVKKKASDIIIHSMHLDSALRGVSDTIRANTIDSPLVQFLRPILSGFLFLVLIFLSVAGNILVCVAIYTDRGLRRIGNLFLASLAIADLFVGCLVMTFAGVNDLLGYWVFGPRFCDTWIAFDVMCSTASILNLCAISLDRYIHIKDPLR